MSRLIVKNLPKSISAKKLEEIFATKGTITDLQLKYSKEGVFRQFAFVGYKTDNEAREAKEYFNNTFVKTSRIQVDVCAGFGDPQKPKSRKHQKVDEKSVKEPEAKAEKNRKKKKNDVIPKELKDDVQFKEFLALQKDRKSQPIWADNVQDDITSDSSASDSEVDCEKKDNDSDSSIETQLKSASEKTAQLNECVPIAEKSPQKVVDHDDSFTVKIRNLPYKCKKKHIKTFFHPLKIASLRLPPKVKGFAYVKFKSEKDVKQALNKNKGFLDGHRIDVIRYSRKIEVQPKSKKHAETEEDKEKNLDLLAETGRIYVRNLCYTITEAEIDKHFKSFGPLAEVHIPIDYLTKKAQGFAFVTYVFAEHAVKAYSELDGTIFQGRMLHLLPANPKKEYDVDENEMSFKKKKEFKMKQLSGSSHNWNILFLGANAVADVISEKYRIEKSKLLSGDTKESVAVRMAFAETQMVAENREFLIRNGVKLDAFSQPDAERSKTVIVVKHLPAKTTSDEMSQVFSKHGTISRLILPPSGLVALVEYDNPAEAKAAFKKLAYSRFRHLPLYLEWAPVGAITDPVSDMTVENTAKNDPSKIENTAVESTENDSVEAHDVDPSDLPPGTALFVRNLNFETTEKDFKKHFQKLEGVHSVTISKKMCSKTGKLLSMGFGFVQFKDKASAIQALQNLQFSHLDGHAIELKFANRSIVPDKVNQKKKYEVKKQGSAKILTRNIPFQATEKEIRELFQQFGTLKFVRLPKKLGTSGEHRGFGFIEFADREAAKRAFEALCHSTHLYGRRLVLEWANENSEDVDELRKKTARDFGSSEPRSKLRKTKLKQDVAQAYEREKYEAEDAC